MAQKPPQSKDRPPVTVQSSEVIHVLALQLLVEQLRTAQPTALLLRVPDGQSLRSAAERLGISAMSVQRAQKKALAALRQQLVA